MLTLFQQFARFVSNIQSSTDRVFEMGGDGRDQSMGGDGRDQWEGMGSETLGYWNPKSEMKFYVCLKWRATMWDDLSV